MKICPCEPRRKRIVQLRAEKNRGAPAGLVEERFGNRKRFLRWSSPHCWPSQFIRLAFRSSGITSVASRIYSLVIVLPLPAAYSNIFFLSSVSSPSDSSAHTTFVRSVFVLPPKIPCFEMPPTPCCIIRCDHSRKRPIVCFCARDSVKGARFATGFRVIRVVGGRWIRFADDEALWPIFQPVGEFSSALSFGRKWLHADFIFLLHYNRTFKSLWPPAGLKFTSEQDTSYNN